jgi:hypothetical protein
VGKYLPHTLKHRANRKADAGFLGALLDLGPIEVLDHTCQLNVTHPGQAVSASEAGMERQMDKSVSRIEGIYSKTLPEIDLLSVSEKVIVA